MKKAMGITAGIMAAAAMGGAAYVLMDKKRRNKAERMICNALDDANNMINEKIN